MVDEYVIDQVVWLYERHYRDVYQFLLYFTGNANDAEDLTQEVYIRLMKALPGFQQHSQMKTWVFAIAKHVAIDFQRKKRLQKWFSGEWLQQISASAPPPEAVMETKETEEELIKEILTLKPQYRMVIILRGIKEYSVKETAEILGYSESKVKVNFHRAIKLLKERMGSSWKGRWNDEMVR